METNHFGKDAPRLSRAYKTLEALQRALRNGVKLQLIATDNSVVLTGKHRIYQENSKASYFKYWSAYMYVEDGYIVRASAKYW